MEDDRVHYPLTHPQKGIWFTEKFYPGTSIGNIAATLRIEDKLDVDLLNRVINGLVQTHDSLRFRFTEIDGEPFQYLSDFEYKYFDYMDFTAEGAEALYSWDSKQTHMPFELMNADLYYFAILKISDHEFGIYTKLHHLISDGWSVVQIGNIIVENYFNLVNESNSIHTTNSYIDFIESEEAYLKSERFQKDKKYWEAEFDKQFELTTLKNISATKDLRAKRKTFVVPSKLSSKIRQYCKDQNTSIFSLFLSAICIYIHRITSREDMTIGVPVLNRSNSKEKDTLGMFVSTIPLRIKFDENMDFDDFLKAITKQWFSALRHQKYPYELILKSVRESFKNIDTLYNISLSYQNAKFIKSGETGKHEGRWHFNGYQTESLYIHINDREDDGNIILDFDYNLNAFKAKEIEFIYDHATRILWHALDNSSRKLPCIEMISEKEKHKILFEFNNTTADYPKEKTLQQLFEEQVERTPDHIALIFENTAMTYRELNRRANRLAWQLRESDVRPNTVVGILLKRSMEMIIAIMAILKAGGTYLPLDPEYPENRIKYMLEDSNATVLVTDASYEGMNDCIQCRVNVNDAKLKQNRIDNINHINSSKDAAYLIYTSGSTGKPKGVVIEHKSVVNFITGMASVIDFCPDKIVASLTTICFDIFVLESLLPLLSGLTVVVANEQQQKFPELIKDILIKNKVNILQITPSRLQLLLNAVNNDDYFDSLTEILIGGEPFPAALLDKLKSISPAKIYNVYGPTETTVWSTVKNITDNKSINIGKPIVNTRIYILDKYLNPAPIGIPGNLFIGGDGLSKGYFNRPELTESKFINNPFVQGEKIYNTGDLARWYPQGEIQHLGRVDNQVKINGFRIELGEIENKILKYGAVKEAVVVDKTSSEGKVYLCAYIVCENTLSVSELKSYLFSDLPYYMVPASFVQMEHIPATPNGKIDRKSLPEPSDELLICDHYEGCRNEMDRNLLVSWNEIFHRDQIGINDSFFDLGGDSLTIIQLQSALLKYGIQINTQDLYKYQTIKLLSDMLMQQKIEVKTNFNHENIFNLRESALIDDEHYQDENRCSNVLLTGVTGFLGIHLLENLIRNTTCTVFCLIRGKDQRNAIQRLKDLLLYYFDGLYVNEIGKRIQVIEGNFELINFGLPEETYHQIGRNTDMVIHSAALVKHYGFYDDFYKTNVKGTENIARFCLDNNIILHHISTMSVAGNFLTQNENGSQFTENDFYIGQAYEENVYVRSKFETEQMLFQYISRGLKAAIYRVGILTGRYQDGLFQINMNENAFYRRIKSIIQLGYFPESIREQKVEFTPVDYCSDAIRKLLSLKIRKCKIYHIYNDKMITIERIIKILNANGYNITCLRDEDFKNRILQRTVNNNLDNALAGIVNDLNNDFMDYDTTIEVRSEKTLRMLKNKDFKWPVIGSDYIMRVIHHMSAVKFLEVDDIREKMHAEDKKLDLQLF